MRSKSDESRSLELERFDARWRLGLLESVRIEATREDGARGLDVAQLLKQLWQRSPARQLKELIIACPSAHEEVDLVAALGSAGVRPSLRRLWFETNTNDKLLSWTTAGDLGRLSSVFPNLSTLWVEAGSATLEDLCFPRLQQLDLRTTSLDAQRLEALATADWPSLQHLGLWLGSRAHGSELTCASLQPLLESTTLPRLRSLGLANGELTDELCEWLVTHPLLARLETLDLSKGTMTERGAEVLLAHAAQLRHLLTLNVDDNYLSPEAVEALEDALPCVLSRDQRTVGHADRCASMASEFQPLEEGTSRLRLEEDQRSCAL